MFHCKEYNYQIPNSYLIGIRPSLNRHSLLISFLLCRNPLGILLLKGSREVGEGCSLLAQGNDGCLNRRMGTFKFHEIVQNF